MKKKHACEKVGEIKMELWVGGSLRKARKIRSESCNCRKGKGVKGNSRCISHPYAEGRYREFGREKRWNLRKLSGCD